MERTLLRLALLIGLAALPITFKKKHVKERAIVFFSTGYIVSFLAQLVVKGQKLNYTVRPLPRFFDTNVIYEHLILPLFCVWFNQSTYHEKVLNIIWKAVFYSSIHTIIEFFIEKKTGLVDWRKWTWLDNVGSLSLVFIGSRGILALFKWLSNKYD